MTSSDGLDRAAHPFTRAQARLFGHAPRTGFTLLARGEIERAVLAAGGALALLREEASELRRGLDGGLDKPELAARFLLDVLGRRAACAVMAWSSDAPPWAERAARFAEGDDLDAFGFDAAPDALDFIGGRAHTVRAEPASKAPQPSSRVTPAEDRQLFGRFLRARGHITLQQLIDALTWQRQQRPRVGRIAVDWRILTLSQVCLVLRDREPSEPFLEAAVRLGVLTPAQQQMILGQQAKLHKRLGEYFVEKGILSRADLARLLFEHQRLSSER